MFSQMVSVQVRLVIVFVIFVGSVRARCDIKSARQIHFQLQHSRQRSTLDFVHLQNVHTLQECIEVTRSANGMAFNYAPSATKQNSPEIVNGPISSDVLNYQRTRNRSHLSVWKQPEEFFNCHTLQYPEIKTQSSLVNDSRFNYYSSYSLISAHDVCVPGIGIFQIHGTPATYLNASLRCRSNNVTSTLAHIISQQRTETLATLLMSYKPEKTINKENITSIPLAFVGLSHNPARSKTHIDFKNENGEHLNCFLFRAWARGHPKHGAHCIALSRTGSWLSIKCDHKLPFICEIVPLME